ncbi:phospholipid phosphatase-related protein type 5-like [Cimex lectularius]|uniref:Phosphatidic acid phosphatase type 2/haloperoxidase domain-containing protein n=1 Tax=Cimex lectularius TaxID=79782 RepID=A0A8I6TGR2_CIMLE|nr:phospholipid phosphatase-related protein type 5-like [Cimex lectularius]
MEKALYLRFAGDAALLLLTIILSFTVSYLLKCQPKGINCADISIQKRYKPPFISEFYLNLAFGLFSFIFLMACELSTFPWKDTIEPKKIAIMKTYTIVSVFTFGMFAQSAFVTFLQIFTGEPRPHFLFVCKPNEYCALVDFNYIPKFTCTGDASLVKTARQSFPSSVAARSSLSMVFLSIYVHSKFSCERTPYGKCLLQAIFTTSSLLASIQLVSDNMNHWRDIYSGIAMGTCSATYLAYSLKWFKTEKLDVSDLLVESDQ